MKKRTFDWFTQRFVRADIDQTILVAGAPRSGTTWLAELLRELPGGYKLINEPLRLSTNPRAREAGFDWRTRVPPGADRPNLEGHLREVLQGNVELGPAWHFRSDRPMKKFTEHVTHRRVIIKLCRAGRMLKWVHERFDHRGTVLIVRHPCAVIASMLTMGDNWQPSRAPTSYSLVDHLPGSLSPEIERRIRKLPSNANCWTGRLALQWSLDYYYALKRDIGDSPPPWTTVTYEELLTKSETELKRIVNVLGGRLTESMKDQIGAPSGFASGSLETEQSRHQLLKWRDQLTDAQTEAVLSVADVFFPGVYDESPCPALSLG